MECAKVLRASREVIVLDVAYLQQHQPKKLNPLVESCELASKEAKSRRMTPASERQTKEKRKARKTEVQHGSTKNDENPGNFAAKSLNVVTLLQDQ